MSQSAKERPKEIEHWKTMVLTMLISALVIIGFNCLRSIPPGDVVDADAGFRKAKQTIDPEKLRAWAIKEIAKGSHGISDSDIPDYVRHLYSEPLEGALIQKDLGVDHVDLTWGGGFFHWGFSIGPTNFSLPTWPQNNCTVSEWVPGVYYAREDTRHKIQ